MHTLCLLISQTSVGKHWEAFWRFPYASQNSTKAPMKLTKATIARLQLTESKSDEIFFDDDVPGFGLRIRAGGKKTWILQYRVGKQQRRITLGAVNALDP